MDEVSLQFFGAVETVTGSRFLVTHGQMRLLIDCGMFQGEPKVNALNNANFPIDESSINAIILTHAHLDHCGYIPALAKNGFKGSIFCSDYTKQITEIVLLDAAHLQMQEEKFQARKKQQDTNHTLLYNEEDVQSCLLLFKSLQVRSRIEVLPNIFVTLYPSGHILGATFVMLEIGGKSLLFSGDLGPGNHPFLVGPDSAPQPKIDAVVTESTYGDREHDTTVSDFARELNMAIARGGSILIPVFTVDRTEEILFELRRLFSEGSVKKLPVFLDSPMGETVLNRYRDAFSNEAIDVKPEVLTLLKGTDAFDPGQLREMYTVDESKELNDISEQSIIVSSSGMSTGGRVTFHLQNMLPDPMNTVIIVGYQVRGTRGLMLEQGAKEIRIHGDLIPVRAHVVDVESFSVHADQKELLIWLKPIDNPTNTFIVHGERTSQEALKAVIENQLGWKVTIPELLRSYPIT